MTCYSVHCGKTANYQSKQQIVGYYSVYNGTALLLTKKNIQNTHSENLVIYNTIIRFLALNSRKLKTNECPITSQQSLLIMKTCIQLLQKQVVAHSSRNLQQLLSITTTEVGVCYLESESLIFVSVSYC